jgi:hypothetical protein
MARQLCFFALVMSALLLPSLATAQAPPATKTPVAPKADQIDPNACAQSDTQGTVGKGAGAESHRQDGKDDLSEKLARSGGVICPLITSILRSSSRPRRPAARCRSFRHPAASERINRFGRNSRRSVIA